VKEKTSADPCLVVAVGVPPAVEPVRPSRRTALHIFVTLENSHENPGGKMPALYGRRDAYRHKIIFAPLETSRHCFVIINYA